MKKIILILILLITVVPIALAEEPEILVNWKSNGFVPYFYQGKNLPTNKTSIRVAFNLIRDDGGLINLNNKEIRWFIDGKLIDKGIGLQAINFIPSPNRENASIAVDVVVIKFNDNNLSKVFTIPITIPEIVINSPLKTSGAISSGINIFRAWPFFFNVKNIKDLLFKWEVNNQKSAGDVAAPNILELQLPKESLNSNLTLSVSAQNRFDLLEIARKIINL